MASKAQQSFVGLTLAVGVLASWLSLHVYGIFLFRISSHNFWEAGLIIAVQTWLAAGLFIVAHDAIHGSLAPRLPVFNQWFGRLALMLYAFFPYDKVAVKHSAHHRHSGRDGDPDFYAERPRAFWLWYVRFFREYFGWPQLTAIFTLVVIYAVVLRAPVLNILLFWALPSIASSVQLFTFGTWLPHRHKDEGFCDHHNARTLHYSWLGSLAACFHFGYHLEHHRSPQSPWWALPKVRAARLAEETAD